VEAGRKDRIMTDDTPNEAQPLGEPQQGESAEKAAPPAAAVYVGGILNWGPGGRGKGELVDAWTPSGDLTATWGPYYSLMFPPKRVTPWIKFKRASTGVNVVRRLWNERENLRLEYEAIHGTDPGEWPARHPGVVLETVKWVAHPACLGCQWFRRGVSMRDLDWRESATEQALLHQVSNGQYREGGGTSGTSASEVAAPPRIVGRQDD
jgi:hypothetical protein